MHLLITLPCAFVNVLAPPRRWGPVTQCRVYDATGLASQPVLVPSVSTDRRMLPLRVGDPPEDTSLRCWPWRRASFS